MSVKSKTDATFGDVDQCQILGGSTFCGIELLAGVERLGILIESPG